MGRADVASGVIAVTASDPEEMRVGVVLHDCDPDLSRTPVWAAPVRPPAPGLRSTLVLLALLLATGYLAVGGFALGLAIPAGAVALLTAWALVRRTVRFLTRVGAPAR
jgi:hypothetical protein